MKNKLIILWSILSYILVCCSSSPGLIPGESEISSPDVSLGIYASISPTSTNVQSTDVNSNLIETSTVIEESLCELPCWQGVLPGVTTWVDLGLPPIDDQLLREFTYYPQEKLYAKFVRFESGKFLYSLDVPPTDYELMKTKLYISSIDLETIQRVDVGENNSGNPYSISLLFQIYGEPLDLRIWRYFIGAGVGYIHIGFYFPGHGIVANSITSYEAPDTGLREICLEENVSLQLWNPADLLLFEDYSSYFDSVQYDHPPTQIPLKESIESYINIDSYEELIQSLTDGQYCFEFNLDSDW